MAQPLPPVPSATSPEPDDFALMAAIRAGEPGAFDALAARWRPRVVNFLRSLGADSDGADDGAQETLLRVYRYRDAYEPRVPFPAFLFTLARRAFLDQRRRAKRSAGVEPMLFDVEPAPERGPSHADRLDLAFAVAQLPRRLREVVAWGVLRGLPYDRVAALLGIPVGTVKSRMFHAIRRLRKALGGEDAPR